MPTIVNPDLSSALDDYLADQLDRNRVAIPTQNFWNRVLLAEQMQPSNAPIPKVKGPTGPLETNDYIVPDDAIREYSKANDYPKIGLFDRTTADQIPNPRISNPNISNPAMPNGDRITNLSPDEIRQMYQVLQTLKEMNGTEVSTQ